MAMVGALQDISNGFTTVLIAMWCLTDYVVVGSVGIGRAKVVIFGACSVLKTDTGSIRCAGHAIILGGFYRSLADFGNVAIVSDTLGNSQDCDPLGNTL